MTCVGLYLLKMASTALGSLRNEARAKKVGKEMVSFNPPPSSLSTPLCRPPSSPSAVNQLLNMYSLEVSILAREEYPLLSLEPTVPRSDGLVVEDIPQPGSDEARSTGDENN